MWYIGGNNQQQLMNDLVTIMWQMYGNQKAIMNEQITELETIMWYVDGNIQQ